MNNRYTKHGDFKLAFIDLLYSTLGVLIILFMISIALISPVKKKNEGVKKNAEYIITMEWPENIDCDIDLWVRDPANNTISYRLKEAGLMYIERDDMGRRRSVFTIDGRDQVIDPDNKEYVTLRGTFPGEYIVNVHAYSCGKGGDSGKGLEKGSPILVPVMVEVIKLNPDLILMKHVELMMRQVNEEQTAFRFVMNENKFINRFFFDYITIVTGNKDAR